MATEAFMPGNDFRLYRRATGSDVFFCLATTKSFSRGNNYEEAMAYDCADPSQLPWRKSVKTGRFWGLNFSGKMSSAYVQLLEDDVDAAAPVEYRLGKPDGDNWLGSIHFENLEISSNENGIVQFTVTARGDDAYTFTAAA